MSVSGIGSCVYPAITLATAARGRNALGEVLSGLDMGYARVLRCIQFFISIGWGGFTIPFCDHRNIGKDVAF